MVCTTNLGFTLCNPNPYDPEAVRGAMQLLNEVAERVAQMAYGGQPVEDQDGDFVRDEDDQAIVRVAMDLPGLIFPGPQITIVQSQNNYNTGTVEVVGNYLGSVVTLSGGTWPDWAGPGSQLVVSGDTYNIQTRNSDSELILDDPDVDVNSGASHELDQIYTEGDTNIAGSTEWNVLVQDGDYDGNVSGDTYNATVLLPSDQEPQLNLDGAVLTMTEGAGTTGEGYSRIVGGGGAITHVHPPGAVQNVWDSWSDGSTTWNAADGPVTVRTTVAAGHYHEANLDTAECFNANMNTGKPLES